jgi:hypothetical protein
VSGQPSTSGGITAYTFSQADVQSGLTLTNHGDQSDTLTVTEILNGNIVGSTQTITVTDPPVSGLAATGSTVKDNVSSVLPNALKVNSGTFELNNGSLQASLISIALAGAFLVEHGSYALSTPIVNDGQFTLEGNGTLVDITGAPSGLGSFTINAGATLQFGTGLHTISGSTADNGTISGLTGSDQIDLANINWQTAQVSGVSYSATANVTTLVITDGRHADTILLVGDYTNSTWTFSSDGKGGTIVVDPLKTVVALRVTDSSAVADTMTSNSDPTHSSNSSRADDATTTHNVIDAPTTETMAFTFAGLDLSSDHIRFENTVTGSTATVSADGNSNSSSHSALVWLANFVHGEANDHSAALLPPHWALDLQSNNDSQSAKPAVAHVELENSYSGGGKNLSFIDSPSQAAPYTSSTVPAAANHTDNVALPSLPKPALDAPSSDHDASPPAAHMWTADADQQSDDAPRQAKEAHMPSEIPAGDPEHPTTLAPLPTAAFDTPAFEHKDAPIIDSDPEHAGLAPQHIGLSSQSAEHHLSDTSAYDALAFEHKDAPTADSDPGHKGSAPHAEALSSQSAEQQLSDTSADDAADRSHHPSSPTATADLFDDPTPPAAHSAHAHADSSPQPIQQPSDAAALPSSNIPADSAASHSAPPSLHGLALHAVPETPGHAADHLSINADAAPQLIAPTTQTATHPLPGYVVSLPTDQFQFSDLNANGSHQVPHASDLISGPPASQALIEAIAPVDHIASVTEIPTIPGTELLVSHSHHAAAHAHDGVV